MSDPDVIAAAAMLAAARRTVRQVSREALPPIGDLKRAYSIAAIGIERRVDAGARRTGRKIGLTSEAVRRQLGVDQPSYGVLLDEMDVSGPGPTDVSRLAQPRIEAEIALVLGKDMPGDVAAAEVAAYVDHARAAAEIVDSAIADWRVGLLEHVADNGSAALYALSPEKVSLSGFDATAATMRMSRNGTTCSEGRGADCLGGPLLALAWLARAAAGRDDPLRAGEVILTGALGPISPVAPGDRFRIEIASLAPLDVSFAGGGE